MTIRQARQEDVEALISVDHIAQTEEQRREFIRDSTRKGSAFVALEDGAIVGYAVLENSFFNRGFIEMLMVGAKHRRKGVGTRLVRHAESLCETERIFTSTNESNLPMQSLMAKLGYKQSGVVDDLDPGDPELFYSKDLSRQDKA